MAKTCLPTFILRSVDNLLLLNFMLLTIKPQAALLIHIESQLPPRGVTLLATTPGRAPETRRL
jgi:hypothetical protein